MPVTTRSMIKKAKAGASRLRNGKIYVYKSQKRRKTTPKRRPNQQHIVIDIPQVEEDPRPLDVDQNGDESGLEDDESDSTSPIPYELLLNQLLSNNMLHRLGDELQSEMEGNPNLPNHDNIFNIALREWDDPVFDALTPEELTLLRDNLPVLARCITQFLFNNPNIMNQVYWIFLNRYFDFD